jgi:hypothetical protein
MKKVKKVKTLSNLVFFGVLLVTLLSSCSISLPRFSKQTTGITITNNTAQIEALKKEDYSVLRTTTGKASTVRCYILFIPIGKHKSNAELFDNAYYEAVDNLPNADALLLPRQEIKKVTIPLILFNYNKRTTTVTGVGISINDKMLENTDLDIPFSIAANYSLKENANIKQLKNYKITSQKEFDEYFKVASSTQKEEVTSIDFSKQYAIVVVGKATKKSTVYDVNYLKLKGSGIALSYNIEEGEKQKDTQQPVLILAVDKKYQGDILRK